MDPVCESASCSEDGGNVFHQISRLARKYPACEGGCVSDAALQFKAFGVEGGEVRIGIPSDPNTMMKWFCDLSLHVLNNNQLRKEPYTLRELVYSQTHRVMFTMNMLEGEVVRGNTLTYSLQNTLRERAASLFAQVFKYSGKGEVLFSFIPNLGNKRIDVVAKNVLVDSKEIQRIFGDDDSERDIYNYIKNGIGMDLSLMELPRDGSCLSVPLAGGKCGKQSMCKLIYDELLPVFLHSNPCYKGKCYNAKFSRHIEMKFVEKKHKVQEQEKKKRYETLKRKHEIMAPLAPIPGVDLTSNLLMDLEKVIDLFVPGDPEYVLYINKFICHVNTGSDFFLEKKYDPMTGQTKLVDIPSAERLRSKYKQLIKTVYEEGGNGNKEEKAKKYYIINEWLESKYHLMVEDVVLCPSKPTLIEDEWNPRSPGDPKCLYVNKWVDFRYKVLMRRYNWTEREMCVPGPKIDRTAGLNSYMDKVSKKSIADRTYLEVILEHIFRVYCRKSAILFWAFNGFFYNIFEHPADRIGVNMVVVGNFGVGKSILIEALGEFGLGKGTLYHYLGGDGYRLTSRFNSIFETCLLAFVDEAESKNVSDAIMKSQITETTKMTEVKFGPVRMTPNFTNFIEAGNSYARKIEPGDRRAWCMECDSDAKFMHTPEVRDKLAAACGRNKNIPPIGIIQYIMWLKENQRMFECLDFRTQPYMTAFKKNHILKDIDPVYKWWRDVLSSEVQPKQVKSIKEQYQAQFDDGVGPMDEADERSRWTGETTWNILWSNFKRVYANTKTNQTEFERMLSLCVVLKEKPTKAGDKVVPHADKPLFFGCIAACWAQFDVFLTYGAVQDTLLCNGKTQHEFKWIKQLYISHYKDQRERDVGKAAGGFHMRCESCCRCSDSWAYAQEHCLGEIRAEADKAIDDERKGILPAVFYKEERGELFAGTAAEVCHGDPERAADHGSSQELEAEGGEGSVADWTGLGEDPLYLSQSSQSSVELWY